MRYSDGTVTQAGIRRRRAAPMAERYPGPVRGVVIAVRYADAEGPRTVTPPQVLCDVVLYQGGYLRHVPVLQRGAGVTNGSLWVPEPATRNLAADAPLAFDNDGTPQGFPASLDDIDGDHVVVDFLERSVHRPVIIGALPHPRGKASHVSRERWLSHQGTIVRIDRRGDVVVDARAAGKHNDGETTVDDTGGTVDVGIRQGAEIVFRVDGVPMLRLRADAQGGLELDLGASPGFSVVLGERLQALFDAHVHPVPQGSPTTGPPQPNPPPPGFGFIGAIGNAQLDPQTAVLSNRVRLPGAGG